MKFKALLIPLLFLSSLIHAQDITGIWRGYFNSGYGVFKQQYKYEVQINQLTNKADLKGLEGVTYSYHSTTFYGKALLQGIYDNKNKSLTIKETKLVELKISDQSEPCVMTCYLDYRKEGNIEILEGTFTSVNAKTKSDCGSGYVYLERVPESDFHKEDFLLKKQKTTPPVAQQKKTTPPPAVKHTTPPVAQQKKTTTPPTALKKSTPPVTKTTPKTKPPATQKKQTTPPPVAKKTTPPAEKLKTPPPAEQKQDTIAATPQIKPVAPPEEKIIENNYPIPEVIKERDNPLIKTIVTSSEDINIQLYDNGEIDGDTITVYHNNQVIAFKKGLSKKPINLSVKADLYHTHHEFVMVADNLGSIPPNTALMIITTGGKRYELFISSDEKKNAKVIINYKPLAKDSR